MFHFEEIFFKKHEQVHRHNGNVTAIKERLVNGVRNARTLGIVDIGRNSHIQRLINQKRMNNKTVIIVEIHANTVANVPILVITIEENIHILKMKDNLIIKLINVHPASMV
jgi:hypothetical protein